ncbi:hypothetical protein T09_11669 [Trichinella sp. T9]|nr:hypothetical protein T09_11669 [Trichinella sp. T9]
MCSERNNTDPVGVTRPGGVTRKSRVGKNNTRAPPARSLSEHLAVPSRGQKGFLLRPDLSTFARQLRARHEGGSVIAVSRTHCRGVTICFSYRYRIKRTYICVGRSACILPYTTGIWTTLSSVDQENLRYTVHSHFARRANVWQNCT